MIIMWTPRQSVSLFCWFWMFSESFSPCFEMCNILFLNGVVWCRWLCHNDSGNFHCNLVIFSKYVFEENRLSFFCFQLFSDFLKISPFLIHKQLIVWVIAWRFAATDRDEQTVKFFSPSPVLIRWNWIRSNPDPQNFWKSLVWSSPDRPI